MRALEDATTIDRSIGSESEITREPRVSTEPPVPIANASERYERKSFLGEGGMGEVLLCRDLSLGREVAMKRVAEGRGSRRGLEGRFFREAAVQGQLEHPAVVPVYDFGVDELGVPFFTMRRVRGRTLGAVLDEAAAAARARAPLSKLLSAFARVCLAVHFAHTRGVVHRDLKPDNVMLGDFGEVYVLDWGVARVAEDREDEAQLRESGERRALPAPWETEAGALVGTPGYMAPEQLLGAAVGPATDIYALGAILFEILTLTPLHQGRARAAGDRGVDVRALLHARGRDVPPELAHTCVKATSTRPDDRHATARELADEIERFLAGDRDLATRRELSARHVEEARARAARAFGDGGTAEDRGRAIEEVGRAIALDPQNDEALAILAELVRVPPRERPAEVDEELARLFDASRKVGLIRAIVVYGFVGPAFFVTAWLVMGLKSPTLAAMCVGASVLAGLAALVSYLRPTFTRRVPWVTVAMGTMIATMGLCFGPFTVAPLLAVVNTMCHAIVGRREQRRMIVAIGVVSLAVPLAAELLGLAPRSYAFHDGTLTLSPQLVRLTEHGTLAFYAVLHFGLIVLAGFALGRYRDSLAAAEVRNVTQAWLLRHLVPKEAREAASEPPRAAAAPPRLSPR